MSGEIIAFPGKRREASAKPSPSADEWNHPSTDQKALIRVLLHRIAINMGLPLKAEDYGFLRRYGHLSS